MLKSQSPLRYHESSCFEREERALLSIFRKPTVDAETPAQGAGYRRTVETLSGKYLSFFGAAIGATLLLQVTIITDTILVGQLLGSVPMSGVRVASPIVNILNVLAMLVGVGGSTLASIAMGKRNRASADHVFTISIVLSIVLGVVFALLVAPFSDSIAHLISSDESTVDYTATFLRIVAIASPVYILASVMALLLRADSCIKLSSAVLMAAGVANVAFDLLFMGVLRMGVEGSALATDMGMLVAVLLSLLYFRWPRRTLRFRRGFMRSEDGLIAGVFKNGSPSALRLLFACIALLFLNYVVGSTVGVMGIALLTVCGNIQLLAVAFFSAGGQAALPLEGVLYGERDYAGLHLLLRYVFRIIMGCVVVIIVINCVFPNQIVGLFVPEGIEGADWLLRLYVIGFAPLAANYVMTYYYNTIQQRKVAMTLTLCENLVFYLPLIWVLTNAFGLIGAVASFVSAEILSFAAMLLVANWVRRKKGFADLLLLPDVPSEVLLSATVPVSDVDASGIAHEVKQVLDECGAESDISLRAAIGVEEMIVNAASFNRGGKRDTRFDIIVSTLPECIQISLRDNGAPFDPTSYEPDEGDEFDVDGIQMLHAVATSIEYRFTLGMNQTIIVIRR